MSILSILKDAALLWYDKDGDHYAATTAYYSLLALLPLMYITYISGSFIFGNGTTLSIMVLGWGDVFGTDIVTSVTEAVTNFGMFVTETFRWPLLGVLMLSWTTLIMTNSITSGLHHIWGIPHQGVIGWIKKTYNSALFLVLLQVYLLLLVASGLFFNFIVWSVPGLVYIALHALFYILFTTALFASLYRVLPWEYPALKYRLLGGFTVAILFALIRVVVTWYVSFTPAPSWFGIGGWMIVVLLWAYLSAAILYFGAAVAHIASQRSSGTSR